MLMNNNEETISAIMQNAVIGGQPTRSRGEDLLLPQFGSDSSPQNVSGYKQSKINQYQNLYTTSPAPVIHGNQNMPRQYSHQQMPMFDKSLDFTMEEKKHLIYQQHSQSLIDWINSFNDPYCLLVNSFSDLKDGIALCHLVGFLVCSPSDQEKIKQLVYYNATCLNNQGEDPYQDAQSQLAIQNLDLAINVLKSSNMPVPQDVHRMQASDLIAQQPRVEGEGNIRRLIEVLKSIHEIIAYKKGNSNTRSKSPVNNESQRPQQVQPTHQQNLSMMSGSGIVSSGNQTAMLITPRGNEKSTHSSYHNQVMTGSASLQNPIMSQSTSRGGVKGGGFGSSSDRGVADSASYQHNQLLSYQSDSKSVKENLAPNPTPFQVMPFPPQQQLQTLQVQPTNKTMGDLGFQDQRHFEKSFDNVNNKSISPITQSRRSPLSQSRIQCQPNQHPPYTIPKVNIEAAIQRSQEDLYEIEELQLVQQLNDLNKSYNLAMQGVGNSRQTTPNNNASRLIQNRVENGGSSSNGKSGGTNSKRVNKTSSQEQKERIRQRQQENNDYAKVLKNTQSVIMGSKIADSDVNFNLVDSQKRNPMNFQQYQDPSKQIEEPSLLSNSKLNIYRHQQAIFPSQTDASMISGQRSIRFKDDEAQPRTSRIETNQKVKQPHDQDDDIMSEMQTLKVRPESIEGNKNLQQQRAMIFSEIKVYPADPKTKQRVLEWLGNEIKLLKVNQRLLEDLPLYCKNGVFLCDLANRISGRANTIKGVDRNPKNVTHILNNFNRVLDYLRSFPKFCPRYLWAQRYLMDGNADVVWGLLDDIWHWHHNKISPYDPTHERNLQQNEREFDSRSPTAVVSPKSQSQDLTNQKHKFIPKTKGGLPPKVNPYQLPLKKQETSRNDNLNNISQSFNIKKQNTGTTPIKDSIRDQVQSMDSDRSYSKLHVQRTPSKSNLKGKNNCDMPLQIQNSSSKQVAGQNQSSATINHMSNQNPLNSARSNKNQRNGSSRTRRVDVSAYGSPIARDQAGNLYFLKSGDEIYNSQFLSNQFDERNANSLFSVNKQPPSCHQHIEITDEIEGEIRKWLFDLKFGHYLSKEFEYRDICNDPFSNGILFAELFSFLEKITLLKLIQCPRTIGESRENLLKVLSIIKQRKREFPLKLLNELSIEKILKRDKQTIYQILYSLKLAYPDSGKVSSSNQSHGHLMNLQLPQQSDSQQAQNLTLPYSVGELKLLEVSILNWLKRLGIFSKLYGTLEIDSFIQIQKELSNGILLSYLVSTLFNVKISGIFKDPKIEASSMTNIRKPLEILRRQGRMSQKFTWADREIYEGRLNVVIGLLEDLHRCFDGLPPRKRGLNYFADGPYLGDTLYSEIKLPEQAPLPNKAPAVTIQNKDSLNQRHQSSAITTLKSIPETFKIDVLSESNNQYQEIPSILNNNKMMIGSDTTNTMLNNRAASLSPPKSNAKDISQVNEGVKQPNFSQFLNLKLQKEHQQNFSPINSKALLGKLGFLKPSITLDDKLERSGSKRHNFVLPQPQQDILSSHKNDLTSQYPVAPTRSPLNLNGRCQSFEFGEIRSNIKTKQPPKHQVSIAEYFGSEEHNMNRFAYQMQERTKIQEWIRSFQGGINLPLGFNLEVEPIVFFKDGILLCELIGELEGFKFDNIQTQPKSQASCLQNIRKALQVLKKKNQVPLYLLYSEEEIYNGNAEIILELLKSIKLAYKNKVRMSSNFSNSQGRRKQQIEQ